MILKFLNYAAIVLVLISCQNQQTKNPTTAPVIAPSAATGSAMTPPQPGSTTGLASQASASTGENLEAWKTAVRFNARELITLPPEKLKGFEVQDITVHGWKLTHILFGFLAQEDSEMNFVVSTKVPYTTDRLYGWTARFEKATVHPKRPVEITEVLYLPETPRILRFNSDTTTADSTGKKITTRLKVDPEEVWVFNFWQITPEDPKGNYKIDLTSGKKALKTFDFELL